MSEWRDDPRLGRRVRIAPRRDERPNDFLSEGAPSRCPFCAGAELDTPEESDRVTGADGRWLARVVPNLYPAFDGDDGVQEVVIESPRHVTRFADLAADEAAAAVLLWSRRIAHWRDDPRFQYQLVFKNEGRAAGASLEHAHSQVAALAAPPSTTGDLAPRGSIDRERVVLEEAGLVAHCPPAPRCAFETWIEANGAAADFGSLTSDEARDVALLLRRLLVGVRQQSGTDSLNLLVHAGVTSPWRIEIAPRSAAVAGFELATGLWINPVAPERAAERLRESLRA